MTLRFVRKLQTEGRDDSFTGASLEPFLSKLSYKDVLGLNCKKASNKRLVVPTLLHPWVHLYKQQW